MGSTIVVLEDDILKRYIRFIFHALQVSEGGGANDEGKDGEET